MYWLHLIVLLIQLYQEKVKFWPQYAEELYSVKSANNKEVSVQNYKERTFVFAGNIGEAQGLRIFPRVAELLMKEKIKFKFVIVGDGRDKDNIIKMIRLRNVESYFEFVGRQPAENIPYYLAKYDVGLITLNNLTNQMFYVMLILYKTSQRNRRLLL